MQLEGRTVERMEPNSKEQEIADLEALIARMKADLATARKALESKGETKPPASHNGA